MAFAVSAPIQKFKVLKPVISLDSVLVVDMLVPFKFSPKMFFHDESVFGSVNIVPCVDKDVAVLHRAPLTSLHTVAVMPANEAFGMPFDKSSGAISFSGDSGFASTPTFAQSVARIFRAFIYLASNRRGFYPGRNVTGDNLWGTIFVMRFERNFLRAPAFA